MIRDKVDILPMAHVGRLAGLLLLLLTFGGCHRSENPEATKAYQSALQAWSSGNQRAAEAELNKSIQSYPSDQRVAFFHAACLRSRFAIPEADSVFANVAGMDSSSPYGQAASIIVKLDHNEDVPTNFHELSTLSDANPNDLVLLWMLAVECRTLKRTDTGIKRYQQLLAKVKEGSSLVHQTLANLLDERGQHDAALPHREKAVRLEPAGWSYDGLALTLADLGRFEKADIAHKQAVSMSPEDGNLWRKWGYTLLRWNQYGRAYRVLNEAIAINPRDASAYGLWGDGLIEQGMKSAAHEKYLKASSLDPTNTHYQNGLASIEGRPVYGPEGLEMAKTIRPSDLPKISEKRRREIYVLEDALIQRLFKQNHVQSLSGDHPALVAFRKKHNITQMEDGAISAEGEAKRWYFTPAQRKRAHLPP